MSLPQGSESLGCPKIRTFFRIKALFWPTDLPIPLSIPANFFLIPTNDALPLEYKWAKANFGTPYDSQHKATGGEEYF